MRGCPQIVVVLANVQSYPNKHTPAYCYGGAGSGDV